MSRRPNPLKSGCCGCQKHLYRMHQDLLKPRCAMCLPDGTRFQRCSRCRISMYCSQSCQRGDWPKHKEDCERDQRSREFAREHGVAEREDSLRAWIKDVGPLLVLPVYWALDVGQPGDRSQTHVFAINIDTLVALDTSGPPTFSHHVKSVEVMPDEEVSRRFKSPTTAPLLYRRPNEGAAFMLFIDDEMPSSLEAAYLGMTMTIPLAKHALWPDFECDLDKWVCDSVEDGHEHPLQDYLYRPGTSLEEARRRKMATLAWFAARRKHITRAAFRALQLGTAGNRSRIATHAFVLHVDVEKVVEGRYKHTVRSAEGRSIKEIQEWFRLDLNPGGRKHMMGMLFHNEGERKLRVFVKDDWHPFTNNIYIDYIKEKDLTAIPCERNWLEVLKKAADS
ncbi:hypothetical protein BDZ89DRAFT_1166524 [Hymenopellis radicata]|nr:hypothetical protein BDZ89DRAFT_1166524 [Hymenopellis radicata]